MKDIASLLETISDILNENIDVADEEGHIIFSSAANRVGRIIDNFNGSRRINLNDGKDMFLYIENADTKIVKLVQSYLNDMVLSGISGRSRSFKISFTVQDLLKDIIDRGSVNSEDCKKLNMPYDGNYVVLCITLSSDEYLNDAYMLMINTFNDDNCWSLCINGHIALIKRVENMDEDVFDIAKSIKDIVNSELYTDALIGIGNIYGGIINIKKSFNESKEAIDTGRLFHIPYGIYAFKDMLCERIISQIPADRASSLLNDIFSKDTEKMLDDEIIKTAEAMFENNLNISDSSKELYIHRNTLIYRLDKIQRITGLDIRKFKEAAVFKLALLIKSMR